MQPNKECKSATVIGSIIMTVVFIGLGYGIYRGVKQEMNRPEEDRMQEVAIEVSYSNCTKNCESSDGDVRLRACLGRCQFRYERMWED